MLSAANKMQRGPHFPWHWRGDIIGCERNIKLHFTFHTMFYRLEKKESCWPCLDVEAANVAPELSRYSGAEQVASLSLTSLAGEGRGQFCHSSLEGRVGFAETEGFFGVSLI